MSGKPVSTHLAAKQLNAGTLLVSQGRARIATDGKNLGAELTEPVAKLGTHFAASSIDVDARALSGQPKRRLTPTVDNTSPAQP